MHEAAGVDRVLVVGTSGSGKTTFARRLATVIDAPHVELDALFWNPNWQEADLQTFRARAAEALSGPRWVACGNYWTKLKDITWGRAGTVIWLDLPAATCYRRIVLRTARRTLLREVLWSGNRETITALWATESLLRDVKSRKTTFTERYGAATKDPAYAHINVVHLTSAREVRRWWATTTALVQQPADG
jgi:adenylate kinase family enzyme